MGARVGLCGAVPVHSAMGLPGWVYRIHGQVPWGYAHTQGYGIPWLGVREPGLGFVELMGFPGWVHRSQGFSPWDCVRAQGCSWALCQVYVSCSVS